MAGLGIVSGNSRDSKHICYLNPIAGVMIIPLLQKWHLSVPYGYVPYIPPTYFLHFVRFCFEIKFGVTQAASIPAFLNFLFCT